MEWHGYSSEQIALNNYLEHHGVKGQRWGVRRYQNLDGTLTDAGRTHYGTGVTIDKALKEHKKNISYIKRKGAATKIAGAVLAGTGAGAMGVGAGVPLPPLAVGGSIAWAGGVGLMAKSTDTKAYLQKYMRNYHSLSNQKVIFPKDSEFVRTEVNDISQNQLNRVYATYKNAKDAYYTSPTFVKYVKLKAGNDDDTKVCQNTYRLKADIVAPDRQTRMKMAEELRKTNNKFIADMAKEAIETVVRQETGIKDKKVSTILKDPKYKELKDRMDKYAGEISTLNAQSLNNAENFRYFNTILPKADKTMTKYFNALSEKGYGCIFDDQDKMIANTPFIIFDKSVLEKTGSKELN